MKASTRLLVLMLTCWGPLLQAYSCKTVADLEWILGDWRSERGETIMIESWQRLSTLTFEGRGESRSKMSDELLGSESLRLLEMAGEIFYLAKVDHNESPVPFRLTQCSEHSAVFENPAHDFPKKLEYQITDQDTLSVTVSDGKEQGFRINFSRWNR